MTGGRVRLIVDGSRRDVGLEPGRTLAEALRDDGVPRGCADGTCGACTVLVGGEAVRSCLMLAVQCAGAPVRTVAGLTPDHPGRTAPAVGDVRCGSCTPGLVMLAAGAIDRDPRLAADPGRLRALLAANVCRCAPASTGG